MTYFLKEIKCIFPLPKYFIGNFNPEKVLWLPHILRHKMMLEILLYSAKAAKSLPVSKISSTYIVRITKLDLVR